MGFSDAPLWQALLAFVLAGAVVTWAGTQLASLADRLADRTGLGEAIAGTLFLGLVTSLPGLATSITAALDGRAALALSNALGGIAVQTAFLAIADMRYRRANLEHAVASVQNMIQLVLLVLLMGLLLLGLSGPDVTLGPVHPVTLLILAAAGLGIVIVYTSGDRVMWRPRNTRETVPDVADEEAKQENLLALLLKTGGVAAAVLVAGVVIARSTGTIASSTGISDSVAGAMMSGVVTSLPELITTVAAVKRGALTLAVSDIVGGNFFDVLFVVAVDLAYFSGSVFHAPGVGMREVYLTGLVILLNMVLLLGMIYRQREGPGNIGLESVLILAIYVCGFGALAFAD